MQNINLTATAEKFIKFGLIGLILLSAVMGFSAFKYYHSTKQIQISDAKISGTMVSVRTLTNGKVKEILFKDGDEVKAGDVIAKLEVSVTEEDLKQLEKTVELAKSNYEELKHGQWVKVQIRKMRPAAVQNKKGSATLESLAERTKRMDELFEMGAVSAKERDDAKKDYENAKVGVFPPAKSTAANVPSPKPQQSEIVPPPINANVLNAPPVKNSAPVNLPQQMEEYFEYVDQFQATPPEVLEGAERAIKQAELSLNVARETAQQTEIIAPVSGIIYYSVEPEKELNAGDIAAKIGDNSELWIEAEVSEDVFDKISLGKIADYVIDGQNLSGTVTEKISPGEVEKNQAEEIPVLENLPDKNSETQPAENSNAETQPTEIKNTETPATEIKSEELINNKYILKISLPYTKNFNCKPNDKTTLIFKS